MVKLKLQTRSRPWGLAALALIGLLGGLLPAAGVIAEPNPWALVAAATPGPVQVIGEVNNGCIGGAATLPESGPGFVSIRRARNHFYGHPDTIRLVQALGSEVARQFGNGMRMMVGDLSQPRGGLMSSRHRSHQNGLDVDIWLTLVHSAAEAAERAPEGTDPPSLVEADTHRVTKGWGEPQRFLIRRAAERPEVERIFVNPAIKRALCLFEGEGTPWLAKVRPWWGHDAHIHVRLQCPADSPHCLPQEPVPPGAGCGAELDQWLTARPPVRAAPKEPKKRPPMPTQCGPVLAYDPIESPGMGAGLVFQGRRW